jgi:hypothetical protein
MAKNYAQDKLITSDLYPRKIVIQRILSFSKSYDATQEEHNFLDLLKN